MYLRGAAINIFKWLLLSLLVFGPFYCPCLLFFLRQGCRNSGCHFAIATNLCRMAHNIWYCSAWNSLTPTFLAPRISRGFIGYFFSRNLFTSGLCCVLVFVTFLDFPICSVVFSVLVVVSFRSWLVTKLSKDGGMSSGVPCNFVWGKGVQQIQLRTERTGIVGR